MSIFEQKPKPELSFVVVDRRAIFEPYNEEEGGVTSYYLSFRVMLTVPGRKERFFSEDTEINVPKEVYEAHPVGAVFRGVPQ